MQGMTEEERAAIALVMKRLGQTMDQIGWDKRLRDLTAAEVTALIEEVLEGYGAEMSRIAATAEVPFCCWTTIIGRALPSALTPPSMPR